MKPLVITLPKGFPLRMASGRVIALQEEATLELKPLGAAETKMWEAQKESEKEPKK